jgi:hypothetical protein
LREGSEGGGTRISALGLYRHEHWHFGRMAILMAFGATLAPEFPGNLGRSWLSVRITVHGTSAGFCFGESGSLASQFQIDVIFLPASKLPFKRRSCGYLGVVFQSDCGFRLGSGPLVLVG